MHNLLFQRRASLLESEIDFGFTLVALAHTSLTRGNMTESSRAVHHAESTLSSIRRRLDHLELPKNQRAWARERLDILTGILRSVTAAAISKLSQQADATCLALR